MNPSILRVDARVASALERERKLSRALCGHLAEAVRQTPEELKSAVSA
jgi:hypothetical protein